MNLRAAASLLFASISFVLPAASAQAIDAKLGLYDVLADDTVGTFLIVSESNGNDFDALIPPSHLLIFFMFMSTSFSLCTILIGHCGIRTLWAR